jgi:23S rRNA (uracil1939-C5)-methyltransferase
MTDRCPHLDRCAGCPLMHLDADAQLAHKQAAVAKAFARYAVLADVSIAPIAAADPSLGYRTRVKWMADGARLGMYAKGGAHEVLDTPECQVATALERRIAAEVRSAAAKHGLALEAVDVREAEGPDGTRALVTLVAASPTVEPAARAVAADLVARVSEISGVALNVRGRGPQVLGADTRLVAGERTAIDRIGGVEITATFGAFVQAHRGQAARIAEAIAVRVMALGKEPRVLELFAGSGMLGLGLAARGARVTLVESFTPAVELAAESARRQGLHVTVHAADAEVFVTHIHEGFDAVMVDPPRRGLTPPLREAIAALRPRMVAYLSCDPGTLARDLAHFAHLGLRTRNISPYDMIPHTDAVEALAFLEPSDPAAPTKLSADAVDKAPHVAIDTKTFALARDLSGVQLVDAPPSAAGARTVIVALAKGIAHARGKLGPHGSYRRIEVASGHSLVEITTPVAHLDRALAQLARIGHPVIGSPKSGAATRRHFFEKHAVDRTMAHVAEVTMLDGRTIRSAPAGDFVAALASVGFSRG